MCRLRNTQSRALSTPCQEALYKADHLPPDLGSFHDTRLLADDAYLYIRPRKWPRPPHPRIRRRNCSNLCSGKPATFRRRTSLSGWQTTTASLFYRRRLPEQLVQNLGVFLVQVQPASAGVVCRRRRKEVPVRGADEVDVQLGPAPVVHELLRAPLAHGHVLLGELLLRPQQRGVHLEGGGGGGDGV